MYGLSMDPRVSSILGNDGYFNSNPSYNLRQPNNYSIFQPPQQNNSIKDILRMILINKIINSINKIPKVEDKKLDIQSGDEIANSKIRPEATCIDIKKENGKNYGIYLRGTGKDGWNWDFDPNRLKGKSPEEVENLIKEGQVLVHCREIKADGTLGDDSFNENYKQAVENGHLNLKESPNNTNNSMNISNPFSINNLSAKFENLGLNTMPSQTGTGNGYGMLEDLTQKKINDILNTVIPNLPS